MVPWESMQELLDDVIVSMTKRMAGIDMERTSASCLPDEGEVSAVITEITGTDGFTLVYHADNALLLEIAQKMKRRPVEDADEVGEYTREYFNIICGHMISQLNRREKSSLRFSMPRYLPSPFDKTEKDQNAFVLHYQTPKGSAEIQGIYTNK